MYEKLINKNIKIVFLDGNQTIIHKCYVNNYDVELKTFDLTTLDKGVEIFVPAIKITKIEVLDNGN